MSTSDLFQRPSDTRLSMKAELNGAMNNVSAEAESIAGAAAKIVQRIEEIRQQGGLLNVQPQIMFLTGAMARMMKDLGVAEHLQKHGTRVIRARMGSGER